ncbi:hypothetical protein JYK21_06905 [Ralstonia pickettii]|nr:hypothetical protein [Ralstonia pickettii]
MKKTLVSIAVLFTIAFLLVACNGDNQDKSSDKTNSSLRSDAVTQPERENKEDHSKPLSETNENEANSSETVSSPEDSKKSGALSEYSSEEIEYARVWLQIVGNKDTEELNVWHISAGEQVNPHDDDSVDYSEDVIELGGKMMADGVITYSGNGDGTINLYDIPSHWPSHEQIDESMEKYTKDIIENTRQIYIEPRDDEEIIKLIEKINVQS